MDEMDEARLDVEDEADPPCRSHTRMQFVPNRCPQPSVAHPSSTPSGFRTPTGSWQIGQSSRTGFGGGGGGGRCCCCRCCMRFSSAGDDAGDGSGDGDGEGGGGDLAVGVILVTIVVVVVVVVVRRCGCGCGCGGVGSVDVDVVGLLPLLL